MSPKLPLALLFATTLLACPTSPQPKPPPNIDQADAACSRLEQLDCRDAEGRGLWEPTPGGTSCPQVFQLAANNDIDLGASCIATIQTCDERHDCTSNP